MTRQESRIDTRARRPGSLAHHWNGYAANLLEVVVMITAEGNHVAIHAMPMRDKYARLLEP
jgi:hypothetical protein